MCISGEQHLIRQRQIVAEMDAHGADATETKRLLHNFEDSQVMRLAHRGRLEAEWSALRRGTLL